MSNQIIQIDPTVTDILNGIKTIAARQAASELRPGATDARTEWMLPFLTNEVSSKSVLDNIVANKPQKLRLGAVYYARSEKKFYQVTKMDKVNEQINAAVTELSIADGLLFMYQTIHLLFSRAQLEERYTQEYNRKPALRQDGKGKMEASSVGRMGTIKLQSDILSSVERDFRSRHRTAIRSRLHAAASLSVDGIEGGSITNILGYFGRLIAEIEAVPTYPGSTGSISQPTATV